MKKKLFRIFILCNFLLIGFYGFTQSNDLRSKDSMSVEEVNARQLLELSRSLRLSNPEKSISYAREAYQTAIVENNQLLASDALFQMDSAFSLLELPDTGVHYLRQSFSASQQIGDTSGMECSAKNIALLSNIINSDNSDTKTQVQALKARQEMDGLGNENVILAGTFENQKHLIFILTGLISIFLVLIFILFFRNRKSLHIKDHEELNHKQISEKNILLEKTLSGLRESEEKYRALSESIQDGMAILQNKKIIFINDRLCQLLEYKSQEEMQYLNPEDVIAPEHVQKIITNYEKRVRGEKVENDYPVNLLTKSGKIIETNLCVTLAKLSGVPSIIGIFKVISDSEKYEARLIQEKQKAEQATLAKSLFLAGMSHEIRNHLNSIIGITEVLVESKMEGEQREYIEVIYKSGNKLLSIINDILDLSKIEAGQVNLDFDEFRLAQVLNDLEAMFELALNPNNLYLKIDIAPDIPPILIGDMQRLSQVLINLTGNAIKFTDDGGIQIRVELIEKKEDTIHLKFNVIDTGIGVAASSQDKLFKAFSQTHSAVLRKQKGTGLGLVICKNIVKLMDGDIGIESSRGKGSNFWFTAIFKLPLKSNNSTESDKNRFMDDKILLVEDNLLNQHLTTTILSKKGYKADIADNGKIGVEMFRKKFYPIILMDIQMPEMDGIQATRLIRQYEASNYSSQATIIAVTAHAKEGEKEKLFDIGMNHYLSKPFKPDDLLTLLEYVRKA